MIVIPDIKDKKYVIMGLGRSGTSAALSLQASGAQVWAWDDHEPHRQEAYAQGIHVRPIADHEWLSLTALVLNPSIAHTYPQPHIAAIKARMAGVSIVCDINFLSDAQPQAQFIGITGTNGKSTTTALMGHILKTAGIRCQVGGNIGIAALSLDPFDNQSLGNFVLELSSYQLELTPDLRLDRAVLLNIAPDHLSRHGGMTGYIAAKKTIFHRLKSNTESVAVINIDDPESRAIYQEIKKSHQVITFSAINSSSLTSFDVKMADVYVKDHCLYDTGQEVMDLAQSSQLKGIHNAQNIAAAYSVGRSLGLEAKTLIQGISTFKGLCHRLEYLGDIAGIAFINDSKATNAEAVAKALACYDHIYWILGGQAKENGLEGLDVFYSRIKHAFLIGEAAALFEKQLNNRVPVTQCGTLDTATTAAFKTAHQAHSPNQKSVILLSPACASWDQFKSYEHRGETFRFLFHQIKSKMMRQMIEIKV